MHRLFAFLSLALSFSVPAQDAGAVRVVNRTPFAHRNLATCGATFRPGAVLPAQDGQTAVDRSGRPIGVPGAVASAVQPFGARWPDGSIRFGRVFAVLELPAGADLELPLGAVADAPFVLSPWMRSMAGRIFPSLVVTLSDGSRLLSELGSATQRADLLACNRAAWVVRFRNRIAGTPLLWELTVAFGSDADVAEWQLWIHNSDPTRPDVRCDFQSIEFRTEQASALHWPEKLGATVTAAPGVMPGYWRTTWRLSGPDWIGDAQGISWWQGVTQLVDVSNPDVPDVRKRVEAQQAAITGSLEMMHTGWSEPGQYGPLGSCGALPAAVTLAQADTAITSAAAAWAADKRTIGTWAECMPWGEFSDTARTGEHPTHGVTRLADVCLTHNPRALAERRLAWLGETRRPCYRFEADLSPLTKARHPQWVAWSGTTHWVSQDKLGKPTAPQPADVHNWSGPDPEHWMGETILAPLALITADWRLLEQGRHRMEQLKGHGYLPLSSYAARAICYVSRAAAWWDLALGDAGDLAWTRGLLDYVVDQHTVKWQGKTGPVKPWVTMIDRRYFSNPEREFWIVWQHQFLFGFLEAARVCEHARALAMTAQVSRMCDLEGWDPVTNRPFGGQATKPDAASLTDLERSMYVRDVQDPGGTWHKTDGMVTSSAGTDWDLWALASLDIGTYLSARAGDAAWSSRNSQLRSAVLLSIAGDAVRERKAAAFSGASPVDASPVR